MRINFKVIKGYGLAGAVLLTLGLLESFESGLTSWQADIQHNRVATANAIHSARLHLVNLLQDLTREKSLSQNLSWGLGTSVVRALEGKLRPGELEHVQIFDSDCKDVARATTPHFVTPSCPINPQPEQLNGKFLWLADKQGQPALGAWIPFQDPIKGKSYFALGLVSIGSDWLHIQPGLRSSLEHGHMALVSDIEDRHLLWYTGVRADGLPAVSLTFEGSLMQWLPAAIVQQTLPPSSPTWTLIGLALLSLGLLAFRFLRQTQAQIQIEDERDRTLWELKSAIEDGQASAQRAASHTQEIQRLSEHNSSLAEQITRQVHLDSLSMQLSRTSENFMIRLNSIATTLNQFIDRIQKQYQPLANSLVQIMHQWEMAVATKGTRKFLRSLSETPSENHPGLSQLDEQLIDMVDLAERNQESLLAMNDVAQRVTIGLQEAQQTAGLWRDLVITGESETVTQDLLLDYIAQSQDLVQMERIPGQAIEFRNMVHICHGFDKTGMTRATFVASLYHVYLGLLRAIVPANVSGDGLVCSTQYREAADRRYLVITLSPGKGEMLSVTPIDDDTEDFRVAKALLETGDFNGAPLPSLKGLFPYSISWNRHTAQEAKNKGGKVPNNKGMAPNQGADNAN